MKIIGLKKINTKVIKNKKGDLLKYLSTKDKFFKKFGEIYFSTVKPNFIKAWHLHKKATLNYVCVKGKVKLVLYDERDNSKTFDQYQELILTPSDYYMVTIPPLIWNGFKGIDEQESIIANCMTIAHDEEEMVRKEYSDKKFNYHWN